MLYLAKRELVPHPAHGDLGPGLRRYTYTHHPGILLTVGPGHSIPFLSSPDRRDPVQWLLLLHFSVF